MQTGVYVATPDPYTYGRRVPGAPVTVSTNPTVLGVGGSGWGEGG